jgi:haloalkane dehalogenase
VSGLVLGNTWFWPMGLGGRLFSRVMSSNRMQRRILERNFFIDRMLPGGVRRKLSEEEMAHYRGVQPTAALRVGVAQFPRQIVAATPWLAELERSVARELPTKRTLVTYPMRDFGFRAKQILPRFRATFRDIEIVELERAKHFFLEDESDRVAAAISARFG